MTDKTTAMADKLGAKKSTNPIPQEVTTAAAPSDVYIDIDQLMLQNPSIISSEGAIGKPFNPEGAIGKIGQKIGGPLSKEGMIGSQFDASKNGIAGHVERAVDGPRNPSGSARQS
ncbi:hypothetical protein EV127DRAFT_408814 [Xylaria flabelliformis]|nr:hypothetical protein EV127DRAFT_408814 [Xylaria flabelliformis]